MRRSMCPPHFRGLTFLTAGILAAAGTRPRRSMKPKRVSNPAVTVKLVDEEGRPVADAKEGFYGRFDNGEWACIIGPIG